MKTIKSLLTFPTYGIKNIKVFYIYNFFLNSWFAMGNWFFYWLKFMTEFEIGVFDAIGFGIGMLVEVPSGAIADLLGKRKTIIFSSFLRVFGVGLMAFGDTKLLLLLGNILYMNGYSFYSGAGEALAYDSLVEKKKESFYDQVISKAHIIGVFFTIIAAVSGGMMYSINDRLPWIAWFIFTILCTLISFYFTEPKVDSLKFSIKNYLDQLGLGFKELFNPNLRKYFLAFFMISGIFYLYEWGFIRLAIGAKLGFNGITQSYASAFVTFISILAVLALPRVRKFIPDKLGMILLILTMGFGFLLSSFNIGLTAGLFVITLIATTGNIANPWISIIINKNIDSKYRATSISALAFFTKIPYVLIAVLAGFILEQGKLDEFTLVTAMVLFGGFIVSLFLLSEKNTVNTEAISS